MKKITLFFLVLFIIEAYPQAAPVKVVNLIRGGDMEVVSQDSMPWEGIASGSLRVFTGTGSIVNSTGDVSGQSFPCSVDAGDMNGDGLKDLVVADSAGYFWLFLNVGTKKEPKFKKGELLPFWLFGVRIAKIQLVDFNGDNVLDLVVGDFEGRFFMVRNTGSGLQPKFSAANDLKDVEVKIDTKGRHWCNYVAPYYYDWNGDGKMDLIMGEGTFSANSVFVLLNTGTTAQPNFEPPQLLIRGEGKEHLTPRVIDWNGDGKPDIVVGERDKGQISVFLNKTVNQKDGPWIFDSPISVAVGSSGATSTLAAPVFEDMNEDGLPDLLIGSASGNIRMALNTGAKGAYRFDKIENIKGEQTLPNILRPVAWVADLPGGITAYEGTRFHLLRALSKNDRYKTAKNLVGYEPELDLPPDSTGKSCLIFDFIDPKYDFIKEIPRFMGNDAARTFQISYPDPILLKPENEYELTFFVKGSGFSDCKVVLNGASTHLEKKGNEERYESSEMEAIKQDNFNMSSSWIPIKKQVKFKKEKGDLKQPEEFRLTFTIVGEGVFYLDDVVLSDKTAAKK